MVGKPLGWGPLNNQPHVHLILRGYLLGPISPFKGLQQAGSTAGRGPPSQGFSQHFPYDIYDRDTMIRPQKLQLGSLGGFKSWESKVTPPQCHVSPKK